MKWKIYLWIYGIISVVGFFLSLPLLATFNFSSYMGIVENILFLIATYAYVYNKKVFTPLVWKVILILSLLSTILQIIALFVPSGSILLKFMEQNVSNDIGSIIFTIIFTIPSLIAAYRLGWKKKLSIA